MKTKRQPIQPTPSTSMLPKTQAKRNVRLMNLGLLIAMIFFGLKPMTLYATAPAITSTTTQINLYKGIPMGTSPSAGTYTITGSNTPTSYTATSLPPGLTLNGTTGVISGTPTVAASYTATINVINADGTGSHSLVFFVNDTTYNSYTQSVVPTPTPSETPNGTPYPYPAPDSGLVGPQKVSIVGGIGGYIPNDSKTVVGLKKLVGIYQGTGAPSSGLGGIGDLYERLDGGANTTLYVKTSSNGWIGLSN